ncbi:hybrid sensor histidine kinase/response regulator [Pasteurellaceae bacterium Macca]|nr:hybrid sensor histidine kinase/response regulator [Pasteurellaceae bacterium Macca]
MKNIKYYGQHYVNWVLRLGKTRSAVFGFVVLCSFAIAVQSVLSILFKGEIRAEDLLRSIIFGLITVPFVIYFFNLIVEKLERSRMELEASLHSLSQLREQDTALNAQLEKNSRDKTILMATISHELRTPLNGIIGLSRILLEGELSPQQREYLKTINVSAVSLGHIFSDIIDLEKIDSRRIELFPREVEFSQLISQISHFANLMAEQKQIRFHIDYADDLPDFILVDNARLSQILWNLVSNGVKFTPPNGELFLNVIRQDPHHFSFILRDTGIGIAKAELPHIFTMFYRAESAKQQKAQGSGIGLAISKQIAQLMGGDLQVESELGKGSTFTLTIQGEEARPREALALHQHALKVLLVEDIEVNVVVAKAMLSKFGCEVDVAMTGAEAYQCFENHSYDLILLDIQLPDTTGFEIAQNLRRRYENEEVDYLPLLIALTANIMHTKAEYQQQGMDDVLRKPLSLEALADCLARHFESWAETIEAPDTSPPALPQDDAPFDRQSLREFADVMGKNALLANFALFATLMPNYLANLRQFLSQWQQSQNAEDRKRTAEEAHKIKGAVASVGLIRLQQIAQLAQMEKESGWEEGIAQWTAELESSWQNDLHQAQHWLEKDDPKG